MDDLYFTIIFPNTGVAEMLSVIYVIKIRNSSYYYLFSFCFLFFIY